MPPTLRHALIAACIALAISACGEAAGPTAAAPVTVAVVTVNPAPFTLTRELPGRLQAWRSAEVRARVAGVLEQRLFDEGSDVEPGQSLYQIDPAPYQAAFDRTVANLAKAEANLLQARAQVQRARQLRKTRAISEQELINSEALFQQAQAEVGIAVAEKRQAQINLDYSLVAAPIAGRIGRSLVTEGALVGDNEPTHLATIQQIDPLYVNFSQSSAELLRLRKALARGELDPAGAQGGVPVSLVLEDGSDYPLTGTLLFTDLQVDRDTGQIAVRARIDNPEGMLLPGMYVRARVPQAQDPNAILIPQQAVIREAIGDSVLTVNGEGQIQPRTVQVGMADGNRWLIQSGLEAGDVVVVDGFMKLRPGVVVQTQPWDVASPATD